MACVGIGTSAGCSDPEEDSEDIVVTQCAEMCDDECAEMGGVPMSPTGSTSGGCVCNCSVPQTPQPPQCDSSGIGLSNGGFEQGVGASPELLPSNFGEWVGDERRASAGAPGIGPVGTTMLEFRATTPDGGSEMSNASEVRQAVDLSVCKGIPIQVEGKAQFNRIVGDAETAKTFTLFLRAYEGELSELPNKYKQDPPQELATKNKQVTVEEVVWEDVSVTMDVPDGTDYVLFELIVNELVPKTDNEFDGQFADAASLTASKIEPDE